TKKAYMFFQVLIIVIALYFFVAVTLSFIPVNAQFHDCLPDNKLYISTNGVHTDIKIPVEYFNSEFINQIQILPGTQFVAFGWGDKNFYLNTPEWKDLTFSVAFKALLLKSEASMHVTFYPWKGTNWKPLHLCDQQLRLLIVYILNTFKYDENDG